MKRKSTSHSAFFNLRVLIASVLCLAGVAVALTLAGDQIESARIVLTGVGGSPSRAREAETLLLGELFGRLTGSELIIYPDSGHGGIFQFHDKFAPVAIEFLDR